MVQKSERDTLPLSGPGETEPEPPEIDGYEIIKAIGEGGMGVVWRAKQLSTSREIALKVMSQSVLKSKRKARIRFEREVTIAARLEHPNIARIYESGIHKNKCFYAMELIHGEQLDQYILKQKLSMRETVQLMHKVCEAVQYAHQQGVIHRDLKHSNIIVTPDGEPHVLDFGLARDLLENDRDRKVSLDGDVIGTPEFMSPEQAAGNIEAVDTRSDVYSLGVIFYNLLTGDWPYNVVGHTYEVLRIIQGEEPVRPSTIVLRFNRDIEAILLKTLSKQPNGRYRSAGGLADDLDNWLDNRAINIKSTSAVYVLHKLARKHKYESSVLFLVLVIFISSIYFYSQASASKQMAQGLAQKLSQEKDAFEEWTLDSLFVDFMQSWQAGQQREAQSFSDLLSPFDNFPGGLSARYLLDQSSKSEIEYRKELTTNYDWLADFVVGENCLKNNDHEGAIILFKKSLDNLKKLPSSSDPDHTRLLVLWATNRMQQIINKYDILENE